MKKTVPRVVGLDLSVTATGICWTDGQCVTIGGDSKLGDNRLVAIRDAIREACFDTVKKQPVDLVVIEDLPNHAQGAGITGRVQGVAREHLCREGIPYALVIPSVLKKFATGKGTADKTAMTMALYKRTGLELADDNQVDAWWLRATGMQHLGAPVVELPLSHLIALDKVGWP